jgi:large subunit ribosomal protein L6
MSRIGKLPIAVPQGVTVTFKEKNGVTVKGPLGEMSRVFNPELKIALDEGQLKVSPIRNDLRSRALHGLGRTLLSNMVEGVTKGFTKALLISGVGYRAAKTAQGLQIQIGFSHPVNVEAVPGIEFDVEGTNKIVVKGKDKEQVGQIAANIRSIRPVEPYKAKGIKYDFEVVRKKAGKTGKA